MHMKFLRFFFPLLAAGGMMGGTARAEYSYFSDVPSDADIVVKEVRWPYWNSAYFNTWWSDNWTGSDGVSGYFYNGLSLPAAGSPNPVAGTVTDNRAASFATPFTSIVWVPGVRFVRVN